MAAVGPSPHQHLVPCFEQQPIRHSTYTSRKHAQPTVAAFPHPLPPAGTPSWVVDRRDSPEERFNNHNWVEVWDGAWSFTGQQTITVVTGG